jgi:vacuolar-type H+-ATPase subunit F/Vma7
MRYRVQVIGRPHTASGFALAGFQAIEAATQAEGAARTLEATADPTIGVVLVEETIHSALPEPARQALDRSPLPMVIPFPAAAWVPGREAAEAYLVEILRQAIGYRVRLR